MQISQKMRKVTAGILAISVVFGAAAMWTMPELKSAAADTDTDKVKIMAVGDSITDGYINGDNGYRKYLCYDLNQNGISNFDMVGSKSSWSGTATYDWNGTTITYDPDHSGYSGYTIQNIGSRTGIQETIFDQTYTNGSTSGNMLEAYDPDVILLQIGTNDILDNQLDGVEDRLEELVDKILPYVSEDGEMLYLASIPDIDVATRYDWLWAYGLSYTDDPDTFTATVQNAIDNYNTAVKNLVAEKQAEGANIMFSDINSVIDISAGDLEDGVHPSEQGYAKMGEYWANLLTETYFNGTVVPSTTTTTVTATTTTETETVTATEETTTAITEETTTGSSTVTTATETQTTPSGSDSETTLTEVDFNTDIDLSFYSDITSIDIFFSNTDSDFNGSVTFDGWNEGTDFTNATVQNGVLTVTPSKDYDTMTVHKYFGDNVTLEKVVVHTKGSVETTTTTESTTAEVTTTTLETTATTTTETAKTTASETTTAATTIVTTTTTVETVKGDINGDGKADLSDLILLQKYIIRKGTFTADQAARADLNEDQRVNVLDAILLRYLLLQNR